MMDAPENQIFPETLCQFLYQDVPPVRIAEKLRAMGFHDAEMRSSALRCGSCETDAHTCGPADPQFYMGVVFGGKLWTFYVREGALEEALGDDWRPKSVVAIDNVIDALCGLFSTAMERGRAMMPTHEERQVVH